MGQNRWMRSRYSSMVMGGGALLKNFRVMALCCMFKGCELAPITMYGSGVPPVEDVDCGVDVCRRRTPSMDGGWAPLDDEDDENEEDDGCDSTEGRTFPRIPPCASISCAFCLSVASACSLSLAKLFSE